MINRLSIVSILLFSFFGWNQLTFGEEIDQEESQYEVKQISPEKMRQLRECGALEQRGGEVREYDSTEISPGRAAHRWNFSNLNFSSGSSSDGKGAIVVFAVIGIVVIIAIIPYAIAYIYDLLQNNTICYFYEKGFVLFSTETSKILKDKSLFRSQNDYAAFNYTINIDDRTSTNLGLSIEAGFQRYRGTFIKDQEKFQREGAFILMGPKLYFARSLATNSHGYLEVLGGSSVNPDIGTVSKAQIGFKVYPSRKSPVGFGFALGSLYTNAQPRSGIRDIADQFESFLALNILFPN